jgi:hypothetical protein
MTTERTRLAADKHLSEDGRRAMLSRTAVGPLLRARLDLNDLGDAVLSTRQERDRVHALALAELPAVESAVAAQVWEVARTDAAFRAKVSAALAAPSDDPAAVFLVQAVAAAPLPELVGLDPVTHQRASAARDEIAARDSRVVTASAAVADAEQTLRFMGRQVVAAVRDLDTAALAQAEAPRPNGTEAGVDRTAIVFAMAHSDGPLLADLTQPAGPVVYAALYGGGEA